VPAFTVRLATASDAEAIRAIYNHEVLHTNATFDLVPRSLADQAQWIAARSGAFAAIVVTESDADGETVVGFGSLSPYKERAAYRTSVEDSVYVRSDQRGTGVGRLLLAERIIGEGTQHSPKNLNGTLMVKGDAKKMSPEFLQGAAFTGYGHPGRPLWRVF